MRFKHLEFLTAFFCKWLQCEKYRYQLIGFQDAYSYLNERVALMWLVRSEELLSIGF